MKPRISRLAWATVCLLAGCDLAPPYQPPKLDIPVVYQEGGPWQPANPSDALPRGPWWRMYQDALLDRLEDQLIGANPDLAAAVDNYDAYKDYALELNSGLFPYVIGGASTTRNHASSQKPWRTTPQTTDFNNNLVQGHIHYEVDLWDKIHNQIASGVANAQAAAADLASAQLSLEADLANDYLTLRELDNDTKLLKDTVKAYARYLVIVQQRHSGAIASGLDVSQAAYQLEAAQAQESGVLAQRAVYLHMIASLVGKPASAFTITPQAMDIPVPVIPTSVPSALLQRRPDIAAAERRVAAANALIGVARAAFYPSLNLDLLTGFQSSSNPSLLSVPFAFWTLGPSAVMPLFEGGLRHAELARAVAEWHAAAENYRAIVLQAFQEVEDGLSNANLLSDQAVQQKAAVRDAQRSQKLAFDLYQGGAVNYLDVIVDQTAALQVEQAQIAIEEGRLQASVNLIRALGGGWSVDQLPGRNAVMTLTATSPRAPAPAAPVPTRTAYPLAGK